MLSKPRFPLGVSRFESVKKRSNVPVYIDPEHETAPECPICREAIRYRRGIELKCLHTFCHRCLMLYASTTVQTRGTSIPCPMCRAENSTVSTVTGEVTINGGSRDGEWTVFGLNDIWGNVHAYLLMDARGQCFGRPDDGGLHGPAIRRCRYHRLDPYLGWVGEGPDAGHQGPGHGGGGD